MRFRPSIHSLVRRTSAQGGGYSQEQENMEGLVRFLRLRSLLQDNKIGYLRTSHTGPYKWSLLFPLLLFSCATISSRSVSFLRCCLELLVIASSKSWRKESFISPSLHIVIQSYWSLSCISLSLSHLLIDIRVFFRLEQTIWFCCPAWLGMVRFRRVAGRK